MGNEPLSAADIRNRITEVRKVRFGDIKAHPRNPKTHGDNQRAAFRGSVQELGFTSVPLAYMSERVGGLCWADGHLRGSEVAGYIGDVAILDIDDAEADKLLLYADPIAAMAQYETAQLDSLLRDVQTGDEALQAMLAELAQGAGLYPDKVPVADPGPQIDKADELRQKWGVELGDLWAMGEHRLICGDCTDRAVVERVMGGERAQACVTDPPFNVREDAWDKFDDFLAFTRNWLSLAKGYAPVVAAFFPDKFLPLLPKAAELEGLPFRRSLIWVKPPGSQFAGGQKDGFWFDFELIQVYGEPMIDTPKSPRFSVFDYRTVTNQEHGAEKPVGLYSDIFGNYTSDGGIVYEPFSGTGTNLIACQDKDRRCFAVEISPAYVGVALERWSIATGHQPQRIT